MIIPTLIYRRDGRDPALEEFEDRASVGQGYVIV